MIVVVYRSGRPKMIPLKSIGYGPLFASLAVFDLIGAVIVIVLTRRPRAKLAR
jgi:predicted exporter